MDEEDTYTYTVKNFDIEGIVENDNDQFTLDKIPVRKLLILNITSTTTHKELKYKFSRYGRIDDCILKRQPAGEKSYAFITYKTVEEAARAIDVGSFRGISLHNQHLKILPANSWHQPESYENKKGLDRTTDQTVNTPAVSHGEAGIYKLHDYCLMQIFQNLPIMDRVRIERVCTRWQIVSPESWRLCNTLNLVCSNWWKFQSDDIDSIKIRDTFTTPILHRILHRYGCFIMHIDFSSNNKNIHGNSILKAISKFCPKVQSINLGNREVSASAIKKLAQNCTSIKVLKLQINYCSLLDSRLSSLFAKNKNLQCIELGVNSSDFNGKCLLNLPRQSIREISFTGEASDLIDHFHKIIKRSEILRKLRLDIHIESSIRNETFMNEIRLHSETLKVLEISNTRSYFHDITPILELKNLETLNVAGCNLVHDKFLIQLTTECSQLVNLNISSCVSVTNFGLTALSSLQNLKHLYISSLPGITDNVLSNLVNLKTLDCSMCTQLRSDGLSTLIVISENLEFLDVSGCWRISNEVIATAMEYMKNQENKVLTIKACNARVTFELILEAASSPHLKIVTIDV